MANGSVACAGRGLGLLTLVLHLATASVMAQTASEAGVEQLPSSEQGMAVCGQDQVRWSNTRSFDPNVPGSVSLQATAADGQLVLDLHQPLRAGEVLRPLWCGDVLGDGSQALAYQTFSGGAHCCFSASVVLLAPGSPHLLDADLGNGGLSLPRQLDGQGPLELSASSDVFAYFDDLSFAASPFMPLVYAYDGSRYVEATHHFPDLLQSDIDQATADLAAAIARPAPAQVPPQLADQEQKSIALRLYGLHVLLGDADQTLPAVEGRVSPPVARWLQANAAAASDALAQVYTLDN